MNTSSSNTALDLIHWARNYGHESALFTRWGWREAHGMERADIVMAFGREEADLVEAERSGLIVAGAPK